MKLGKKKSGIANVNQRGMLDNILKQKKTNLTKLELINQINILKSQGFKQTILYQMFLKLYFLFGFLFCQHSIEKLKNSTSL